MLYSPCSIATSSCIRSRKLDYHILGPRVPPHASFLSVPFLTSFYCLDVSSDILNHRCHSGNNHVVTKPFLVLTIYWMSPCTLTADSFQPGWPAMRIQRLLPAMPQERPGIIRLNAIAKTWSYDFTSIIARNAQLLLFEAL